MQLITDYQNEFLAFMNKHLIEREPKNLYEPIHYILRVGGKRLRPTLTMLSADIFGVDYHKALYAALAVEIFHNFSLVHDDIMDQAPLRRGQPTVHTKWNLNTGILSGDTMLILAYQYFEQYEPNIFQELAKIFSKTAIEVCEGQQYDVDFEQQAQVSTDQYLKMIAYKTAVLVGAALKMGAIIAQTTEENKQKIYDFGLALGIAYQLQDEQKQELYALYTSEPKDETEKISRVTELFIATQSHTYLRERVEAYTMEAFAILDTLDIPQEKKDILKEFGRSLMNRTI